MLRLFFRAQYNANMAPLISDMTSTANAMPDIHVVAHCPIAGSLLCRKKESDKETRVKISTTKDTYIILVRFGFSGSQACNYPIILIF